MSKPHQRMSESPFRAIAEYTYDWESWIDRDGSLRWVNPAVERITGYTVAECHELSDYPLPLIHPSDRPAIEQVLQEAGRGEAGNHYEFRVLRKDGEVRWAAISFQPVEGEGGTALGYRSSVRDIHERKRMEARLRAAVQRAEEANQAKTRFLATISHELRTPLQAVLGYAELLTNARLTPPLSDYADAVLEQGKRLQHLVGDLLDFSSLKAGALPLRSEFFDPRELLLVALNGVTPQADEAKLELQSHLDLPERLLGDPQRILQVVTNLLGNAVKFTPRNGVVRLEAKFEASQGELVLTVDDTGPGLPSEATLFEPFMQARTAGNATPGVGLGLAISQQLCRALGGALSAERSPLGGARLQARFPSSAPSSTKTSAEEAHVDHLQASANPSIPRRGFAETCPAGVLVIDDVAPAREFVRDALRFLGYEPQVAASADEGFRLAEEVRPDVIFVDIQMPDLDGWSAARGLRARLGQAPYLIAMTADSQADDAQRLREVGFSAFAQKPLSLRDLQSLLTAANSSHPAQERERRSHAPAPSVPQTPPSLFDPDRWQELAGIEVDGGETLLERMRRRVATALPAVLSRVEAALPRETSSRAADGEPAGSRREPTGLRRSVHDLHGLLSLIGAESAAALADRVETGLAGAEPDFGEMAELIALSRRVLEALE